jgi:MIP family channel proteins
VKLQGTARELSAEFLGTFVLMIFGLGVNAQVTLAKATDTPFFSSFLVINLGWGLAVTMGVYVSGGVSGAHLNPAVTLAMATRRGFAWNKVAPFIAVQVLAALAASAAVYLTYHEALDFYEAELYPGAVRPVESSGIWATYPKPFLSSLGGLIDQIVGTGLLVLCIFALTDDRNTAPRSNFGPVVIGSIVLLVGMTFGYNCGYAINPARDFGPRLFTSLAGWGTAPFQATSNDGIPFWWIPIVGPCIGGVLGGMAYDLFVGRHHPEEKSE